MQHNLRCTCEAGLDVPMMAENEFLSAVADKLSLTFTNPTPTEDDAKYVFVSFYLNWAPNIFPIVGPNFDSKFDPNFELNIH